MKYVWKYFTALNSKRQGTGYGPLPLSHTDILSYFTLYRIDYDLVEIEMIELLDNIAMEHYINELASETNRAKSKK